MLSNPRKQLHSHNKTNDPNYYTAPRVPYRPNNYIQELKNIRTILHQHRFGERVPKPIERDVFDELPPPPVPQYKKSPLLEAMNYFKPESIPNLNLNSITNHANQPKELKFWRDTVPKEVLDSLTKNERLRQECIYETIYTEREFIKTLKLIDMAIIKPIKMIGIFNEEEFETMKVFLFHNYQKILEISENLYERLVYIQTQGSIVENIAPAFNEWLGELGHFAYYGAHLPLAQKFLETRKMLNPEFAKFINEMVNNPAANNLPILSFMNAPTTRLARMILLLKSILKYSIEGSKDHSMIPIIIDMIGKHLNVVDKSVVTDN